MRRPVRLALLALGLLAVLVAGAAVVLPLLVDAESLRAPAEGRLSAALGRPVHLGRLSFSLATGLALRADELRIDPPTGGQGAVFTADRLDVRPRLLPLLRRQVALRSIRAVGLSVRQGDREVLRDGALRARVDLSGGDLVAEGRLAGTVAARGDPAFDLSATVRRTEAVTEVTDLAGTLGGSDLSGTIRSEAGPSGSVLTFDLSSHAAVLDQLAALAGALPSGGAGAPTTGEGSYRAARATLAGRPVEAFETRVRLAGNVVRLDPITFTLHGGRCGGALSVDTSRPSLPFRLTGRADGIDAAAFSPALRGRAGATLDLRGRAGETSLLPTLDGALGFELLEGAVQSVGLLKQVAALLESAGGKGIGRDETPFRRAGATLSLVNGRGRTDDLRVESPDFSLTGSGSIDLVGPLDLDVLAAFSPEVSAAMVGRTPQLRYRLDPQGRLTVPLRLRGTLLAPELKVDTSRLTREVLRERFQEKKERLLDRLLGR